MSALRQKMTEDMQLRGFAERTQEAYLNAVRQLAKHYHKPPDQIEEEELRQYFLFLKNEKQAARNTCTIALCGIKFFFQHTLGREWKTFELLRPPKEKKLAVAAGMVAVLHLLTVRAAIDLPTQGLRAALLNGPHGFEMAGGHAAGVLLAIGRTILAENVCQFYGHRLATSFSIVSRVWASVTEVR